MAATKAFFSHRGLIMTIIQAADKLNSDLAKIHRWADKWLVASWEVKVYHPL